MPKLKGTCSMVTYMRILVAVAAFSVAISCDERVEVMNSGQIVESTSRLDLENESRDLRADFEDLRIVLSEYLVANEKSITETQSQLQFLLSQIDDAQSQIAVLLESYRDTNTISKSMTQQWDEIEQQERLIGEQASLIAFHDSAITEIKESLKELRDLLDIQEANSSTLTQKIEAQRAVSSGLEKEIAAQKDQDKKISEQIQLLPSNSCKIEDSSSWMRDLTFKVLMPSLLGTYSGSAFYIGNSELVTNQHVVGTRNYVTIVQSGKQYPATVIRTDSSRDLALVRTSTPLLIDDAPSFGEVDDDITGAKVGVTGFPSGLGSTASVTFGVVSRVFVENLVEQLQTDAAVSPGSSGGPLFDACGKVVGVITSKLTGANIEGIGFAVSSDELTEFLAETTSMGLR